MLSRRLGQERIGEVHDGGSVKAGVLDVYAGRAVREANQGKGLVEPPVATVAVQQVLASLQRGFWRGLLQAQAKQSRLDGVEISGIAGVTADQCAPADRPCGAGLGGEMPDRGARRG